MRVALRATANVHAVSWLLIILVCPTHAQDTTTIVDDQNPAIKYSGQWSYITGPNQVGNTVMLTRVAGATASYSFTGTGISVFGTQGTPGGNVTTSTYSVDDSSAAQYTVSPDVKDIQYQVLFYTSPILNNGQHTLLITNLNDQAWYWLDSFKVTAPSSPSPTPPTTTTPGGTVPQTTQTVALGTPIPGTSLSAGGGSSLISSAAATSSSITSLSISTGPSAAGVGLVPVAMSVTTDVVTAGTASSTVADTASSHTAAVSTGAAVGIALASAILIALIIFGAKYWRKRVRRAREGRHSHVDPFSKPSKGPITHGHALSYQIEYFTRSGVVPDVEPDATENGTPPGPRNPRQTGHYFKPKGYSSGARNFSPASGAITDTSAPGHTHDSLQPVFDKASFHMTHDVPLNYDPRMERRH